MTTYYMNSNETCEWTPCNAETLNAAKREATREYRDTSIGTVIKLATEDGKLVAIKLNNHNGRWF